MSEFIKRPVNAVVKSKKQIVVSNLSAEETEKLKSFEGITVAELCEVLGAKPCENKGSDDFGKLYERSTSNDGEIVNLKVVTDKFEFLVPFSNEFTNSGLHFDDKEIEIARVHYIKNRRKYDRVNKEFIDSEEGPFTGDPIIKVGMEKKIKTETLVPRKVEPVEKKVEEEEN